MCVDQQEPVEASSVLEPQTFTKTAQMRPFQHPNTRPRALREALKAQIQMGLLEGKMPSQMAQELSLPRPTLYRYLAELGDETRKERLEKTNVLLHSYLSKMEEGIRRLDEQYAATTDPMQKAGIQSKINEQVHQMFADLQSAGFLPKRGEKVEIDAKMDLRQWMAAFFVDASKPKEVQHAD